MKNQIPEKAKQLLSNKEKLELIYKKHGYKFIVEKYKVSSSTVYSYLKKHNINVKPDKCKGIDLIGQKIGSWSVLELNYEYQKNGYAKRMWLCQCDCGNTKKLDVTKLRYSKTKKCQNCYHRRKCLVGTNVPLNGDSAKSGGFKVLEYLGKTKYKCVCTTCGKISYKIAEAIRKGAISCRCHSYFTNVKLNARERKFEFDLDEKYAWNLLNKQKHKCALSGKKIYFESLKNKNASLDRIDSNKGYTKDNVQWLHKDINYIKMDFDQDYFIELCSMVSKTTGDK